MATAVCSVRELRYQDIRILSVEPMPRHGWVEAGLSLQRPRVLSQAMACGVCDGHSGIVTRFSVSISDFPYRDYFVVTLY